MNPESSPTDRLVDRLARARALDGPADLLQPFWQAAFDGSDPVRRTASDALHGTWLGHPLHPLITDVPVGAWTVGIIADLLALGGDAGFAATGDRATTIGVLGAAAAALAGWADWSDTRDDARRLGVVHATCNGVALVAYTASLALRAGRRRGAATAAALVGYALVGIGGYLGGELSYGMQLGMRRTAEPHDGPASFVRVARVADVPRDGVLRVETDGVPLLLARVDDVVHAVSAVCTHRGGPLDEGTREDDCIRCPWHGSRFRLTDGHVEDGPATFPLASWETRVVGDDVEVRARS